MIREYCLPKYRQVYFKNPYENVDVSHLSPRQLFVFEIEKKAWEGFNKNFIAEVNKKHPSTYRNGIKKLNK